MKTYGLVLGALLACLACGAEGPGDDGGEELQLSTLESPLRTGPLSTGVELEYFEQGSAGGDPVILLHGYTDSHLSFDGFLKTFPRSYHVYALDQRGHGASSKPACCYGMKSDFAADVLAFMDSLGIQRAHLIGHSMGSLIAQEVAINHPERVNKLVLIGATSKMAGNPVALSFKPLIDGLVDPVDPAVARLFQTLSLFRSVPKDVLDTAIAESLKVPAQIWKDAFAGVMSEDLSAQINRITAPTLILFGDQDLFFTSAEQQVLDSRIPDSRLLVYAGTGHRLHVELPKDAARDIDSFFRGKK
jgi:non-heme chloroperoxidase